MALSIDAFTQSELAKVSPWTFEQLAEIDAAELQSVVRAVAGNEDAAQPILVWLQATERCPLQPLARHRRPGLTASSLAEPQRNRAQARLDAISLLANSGELVEPSSI